MTQINSIRNRRIHISSKIIYLKMGIPIRQMDTIIIFSVTNDMHNDIGI